MKLGARGVFGIDEYESQLKIPKFKMADPVWLTEMQKVGRFGWNSVFADFRNRWLRIWTQKSEI